MMVALRKILGDLRHAWGRILLLFVAVALGQAAMVASNSTRTVIGREIPRNFASASPSDAMVEVTGFDPANFDSLPPAAGVSRLDIVAPLAARYRLANGTWLPIMLFGRRDFDDLRAQRVFHESGAWPPGRGGVLIERSGLSLLETPEGGEMQIGFGRGALSRLRYVGVAHDPMQAPSYQEGALYGYVSLETMRELAGERPVQFLIMLDAGANAVSATQALSAILSERGARVTRVSLSPPSHPHGDLMNGLLLLLAGSTVLSFILALFVSASIVSSLVQRQQRQIGVLRALGASRLRIALSYLAFALTPALAGIGAGVWLGGRAAALLEQVIAWELNLTIVEAAAPTPGWLIAVGAAGVVAAIIVPISASLAKPVRAILQDGGIEGTRAWLRLPALAPIDQMAMAEAFRRPVRTTITVVALTIAGASLLTSANTFASLMGVVDRFLAARGDDITTTMTDTPDVAALSARLGAIDGLERYELWDVRSVTASLPGTPGMRLPLISPPADSEMGRPAILSGRAPAAAGEITISQVLADRLHIPVGAEATLALDDRSTAARVVGMHDEWGMSLWTNEATYALLAGPADRSRQIRTQAPLDRLDEVSTAIEQAVLAANSFPSNTTTRVGFRAGMLNHFLNFFQFLLVGCAAAAIVGAAALTATISSNVLERTREIGVLRTLGATWRTVFRLVAGQALTLAVFSLVLAIVVSVALSMVTVDMLEANAMPMRMDLKVSWAAIGIWFVASLVIALLAAIGPALRIQATPIRQAIAHD
ncbi:MAG: FtsX-like permease family protein [Hyphomonadaceae bacterium]